MQIDYNALLSKLIDQAPAIITAIGVIVVGYFQYRGFHQRKEIIAQNAAQAESIQQIVNK